MKREKKFYSLDHKKHGVGGLTTVKPTKQKQDNRARPSTRYAMVFFPKVTGIGPATLDWDIHLTHQPQAAPIVFMDKIAKDQTLKSYQEAGWRLRKIKIVDMGDA